jgi:2-succinyl-5-enolpyruvyl-6-hydroxy-3-cyclohexene-1-carboxylate synthase
MVEHSSMLRGFAVINALCDAGVHDIVLAPGSRSAPLALAAATAEREGRVRLHVRIDERSAGYLALGIAKGSGSPVAVITTSGTAAVNLHPAVVEASYGGVSLIAVTADRPPRLRGVGANQTIEQAGLFGGDCRFTCDLVAADADADADAARMAVLAATDPHHPGPVQVNVALEEPLVSTAQPVSTEGESTSSSTVTRDTDDRDRIDPRRLTGDRAFTESRGLIVVGDTSGFPESAADPELIEELAARHGWPIISEPSGNASLMGHALRHGPLVVDDGNFMADHVPDTVVTVGRIGLHRGVMGLLRRARNHVVIDPRPRGYACDPLRTAQQVLPVIPLAVQPTAPDLDSEWFRDWQDCDSAWASRVATRWLADYPGVLDGVAVVRTVVSTLAVGDNLVIGSSWPVRHLSGFAGPIRARVFANRGTSGIDGVISTAWGIACGSQSYTVAIVGDLTAIYDRNGLLGAPGETHPHATYVVIDNDGGGIFGELEQADPAFRIDFERVFGTPHGADVSALLSAPGVEVVSVEDPVGLTRALTDARMNPSVTIIVATTENRADQVHQLRTWQDGA